MPHTRLGAALFALALASPLAAGPLDEGDDQYQFLLGLSQKGLHDLVVKEGETFLREHAGHAKARLARYRVGAALFELDRRDEAAGHFRTLVDAPGFATFELAGEAAFRLGQCELSAGRPAPAIAALEAALASDADYLAVDVRLLLGEARFQAGDFARAERDWDAALRAAKLEMLRGGGKNAHPARWSAFVLWGLAR